MFCVKYLEFDKGEKKNDEITRKLNCSKYESH